jgi:hypothetical protein
MLPPPEEDAVLAGAERVRVHSCNVAVSACCQPLACGWVEDVESSVGHGEQEKSVAGGVDLDGVTVVAPEDGLRLGGDFADVEGVNHVVVDGECTTVNDEWERWLAPVVVEQELACGGGDAP